MRTLPIAALLLAALFVAPLPACSSSSADAACRVGADCASGACGADGRCAPIASDDAGHDAPSDAIGSDTKVDSAPLDGKSDAPSGCTPNGDFQIDPAELPLAAGLKATYRVATSATVSTAGVAQPDGTRRWDLSGALAGDKDVLVETLSPAGAWWSADFAGASYAVGLSASSDLLGVFTLDAVSLSLRGIVSPTSAAPKTELTYATPIPFVKLPLKLGSAWTTTSNVSGTASGFPAFVTESYDVKVDQKGTLVTPFAAFPVLRVRTTLTRTVGAVVTVTRSFGFVAECFGTVGSVTSNPNEPTEEFTTAAEARRLAP